MWLPLGDERLCIGLIGSNGEEEMGGSMFDGPCELSGWEDIGPSELTVGPLLTLG